MTGSDDRSTGDRSTRDRSAGDRRSGARHGEDLIYERLALVLRVGAGLSLILLVAALTLFVLTGSTAAPWLVGLPQADSPAEALAFLGVAIMLALPLAQALVAGLTYHRNGVRTFALVALGLLVIQVLAVVAAGS